MATKNITATDVAAWRQEKPKDRTRLSQRVHAELTYYYYMLYRIVFSYMILYHIVSIAAFYYIALHYAISIAVVYYIILYYSIV